MRTTSRLTPAVRHEAAMPTDLARQLRLHLEALKAAGVEFLPRTGLVAPVAGLCEAGIGRPACVRPATEEPPDPLAARRHALTILADEAATCECCSELFSTRTQTVFGVGPLNPDVCFVGEAPGADEDAQGLPFVGRAGQLLTRIILACGFQRDEVYVCNALKCRPPNNRTPTPDEVTNCRPFVERQIQLVKPKHIVALGGTAAKALLKTTTGITRLRGTVHDYQGVPLVCTFHPSALLRDDSGKMKRDCWEDMKLLLRTMGRPVPRPK
jgi:DNA polymerase